MVFQQKSPAWSGSRVKGRPAWSANAPHRGNGMQGDQVCGPISILPFWPVAQCAQIGCSRGAGKNFFRSIQRHGRSFCTKHRSISRLLWSRARCNPRWEGGQPQAQHIFRTPRQKLFRDMVNNPLRTVESKWCFWRSNHRSTTVDGQKIFKPCNMHCVEPPHAQFSQCFSARVAKSKIGALISFVHWGQCTSGYINIEQLWGRGLVPDTKGLNISCIYRRGTPIYGNTQIVFSKCFFHIYGTFTQAWLPPLVVPITFRSTNCANLPV